MNKYNLILVLFFIFPILSFGQENEEALAQKKEDAKLANKLYNQSLEHYANNKNIEAITTLNKAVRLRPDFAQAYYNISRIRAEM